jgi:hypothetical protein
MNNRTLVASLAVLGLAFTVVPDAASARAGGVAVGGGRAAFTGGIHRVAPRPFVKPRPFVSPHPFVNAGRGHIGRHAPFRRHARRHLRHDRFDNGAANVGVYAIPDSSDYPYYDGGQVGYPAYGGGPVGPTGDPTVTGALPQPPEQDAGADLALARSCKATTTMVPSETRGGMVPVTVTRCRPLDD